jgi:hypothetical protein
MLDADRAEPRVVWAPGVEAGAGANLTGEIR